MPFTVYALINTVNGKRYIGQTKRPPADRLQGHISGARTGRGCRKVNEAIREHGATAFIVESLFMTESQQEAYEAEARFIASFQTQDDSRGYNLANGGKGSRGAKWTVESKAKLSQRMIGNKRCVGVVASAQRREKVRRALMGHVISAETRAKISATLKAKAAA